MTSYAYNTSLYGQLNPGAGYGQTFSFNVDGSVTTAMDGGTCDNQDAVGQIELTAMPAVAGRSFAVVQTNDYGIVVQPYAGDTIRGYEDPYTVHGGEVTVFTCIETGNWKVTIGGAANIISPTYNVRNLGAIGDGSHPTEDTAAFQLAASRCTTRGSTIYVPETDDGALPGYNLTANIWDSLGTKTNNVPGTVMELGGRLLVDAQQILPGGARIIGRTSNNNNTLSGSTIRCTSSFPNDGTSIVRLGRAATLNGWAGSADEAADGTKLEWVTINGSGRGVYGNLTVGVSTTGMQERSGMENCIILGTRHGFVASAGTGINPSNYIMRAVDAWILPTVDGVGFNNTSGGGKFTWEKMTVVTQYNTGFTATAVADNGGFFQITIGDHAFGVNQRLRGVGFTGGGSTALNATMTVTAVTPTTVTVDVAYASGWTSGGALGGNCYAGFGISGSDNRAANLHVERVEYGIEIAHVNANFWTYGVLVDGMHGYNGNGATASQPPMLAMARIRSVEDYVFDIDLRRMSVNTPHGQTVMVLDDRNGVTIPMAEFHATRDVHLGRYYFGGTAENGAVATKIPVECDRFDQTVSDATLVTGSSPYNDYALGRAGLLKIDLTAAGGDVTITSFAGGFLGRKFRVMNSGSANNLILDHAAASGTAANRLLSTSVADITLAPGESADVEYGVAATADRWEATKR